MAKTILTRIRTLLVVSIILLSAGILAAQGIQSRFQQLRLTSRIFITGDRIDFNRMAQTGPADFFSSFYAQTWMKHCAEERVADAFIELWERDPELYALLTTKYGIVVDARPGVWNGAQPPEGCAELSPDSKQY